jgi:hypothetical protein
MRDVMSSSFLLRNEKPPLPTEFLSRRREPLPGGTDGGHGAPL